MNNSIRTYEDLIREEARLKDKLHLQGLEIKKDIFEVKEELKPLLKMLSFIGKFIQPENRNHALLKAGAAISVDWLAKKFLSKNLVASILLPTFLKNASSHLLYKLKSVFVK